MTTDKITVRMSEVIRYTRDFTLVELADVLGVEPMIHAVRAALDADNSNYGTASEDDESLLNAIMFPTVTGNIIDIEDREWGWDFPEPTVDEIAFDLDEERFGRQDSDLS